jgi:hypothetical protein
VRPEWQAKAMTTYLPLPWQCSPGQGAGAAKAPCLDNTDCQSKVCEGTGDLNFCLMDGRPCQTNADCLGNVWCWRVGQNKGQCT